MKRILIVFFAMVVLLGLGQLDAQTGRGNGRQGGKVTFEDKKPVADLEIKLTLLGTIKVNQTTREREIQYLAEDAQVHFSTKTNKKGEFLFTSIGYGAWRMDLILEGYVTIKKTMEIKTLERNKPVEFVMVKKQEVKAQEVLVNDAASAEKGVEFLNAKEYDKAIGSFTEYLKKRPDNFAVHIYLAKTYIGKKDPAKAITEYNNFLNKVKENAMEKEEKKRIAEVYAEIGKIHMKAKKMDKATEFFKKSIEVNPKNEILAYNVAEICFNASNADGAIVYYNKAIQIKPKWSLPYLKLGYAYLNKGDIPKAKEILKKFIEIDPKNPQAATAKSIIDSL